MSATGNVGQICRSPNLIEPEQSYGFIPIDERCRRRAKSTQTGNGNFRAMGLRMTALEVIDDLLGRKLLDWTTDELVAARVCALNGTLPSDEENHWRKVHARLSAERRHNPTSLPIEIQPNPRVEAHKTSSSDYAPLTDILLRDHGWSYFDFKIQMDMAVRVTAKINWGKPFGSEGCLRIYLRSMKRWRRWLGIDKVTPVDSVFSIGDFLKFEKTGIDYTTRRGSFEKYSPISGPRETSDEAIFNNEVVLLKLDNLGLIVKCREELWLINYRILSYTPNVCLKKAAGDS